MNRFGLRTLVAVGIAATVACGGKQTNTGTPDAGGGYTTGTKVLTRVGAGNIQAHPGDALTLSALLSESEVGPVANAKVTWRISQDPGGGTALAGTDSQTNSAGVAQMKVTLGTEAGTLMLRADSDGATSKAVWKVEIKPLIKHLVIIQDGPQGPVSNRDQTGLVADVTTSVGTQVRLRVKATFDDADTERVDAQEPVQFAIPNEGDSQGANFATVGDGKVTTQADGEADITLDPGVRPTAADKLEVTAAIAGAPQVTFWVAVQPGGCTGPSCCSNDQQCGSGMICQGGQCVSAGGGNPTGDCTTSDSPCPTGYQCNKSTGVCEPMTPPPCPNGCNDAACACTDPDTKCNAQTGVCDPTTPECQTNTDCPSGFTCQNGACIPNSSDTIDVTGHWYTQHDFDIHDALPGWVQTIAKFTRLGDQALLGQLNIPSWANALISGIVQQYVPSWVTQLVYLLDNAFTLFSDLRSEGEMDLVANGSPAVLQGTENWTSFVFYLLAQCGTNIGGDPNNPPPCARFDIYTSDLSQANLAVEVEPFAARVGGDTAHGYTIFMDKRVAKLDIQGLIRYVLEQAVQIVTGYPSLEDQCLDNAGDCVTCRSGQAPDPTDCPGALSSMVDCQSLSDQLDSLIGINIDFTPLCQAAVEAAGSALVNALGNIVVHTDVLKFSGQASARATQEYGDGPNTAEWLGYPDYKCQKPSDGGCDGVWTAKVNIVDNVPGRWHASRQPFSDGN